MTKISAMVVADSKNPQGDRITTMMITFPRFILAELNTHRMLSKNSASSRAIPFNKMVEAVKNNPFIPIAWQKEHKGMQGSEYFTDAENIEACINKWLEARDCAIEKAKELNEDLGYGGVTKQLCNRLLEPFMWHTVLVTTSVTEESLLNFFELRCPKYTFGSKTDNPKSWRSKKDAIKDFPDWITRNDLFWYSMNKSQAEIHIQALAEAMWDARNESTPEELVAGMWHIPFMSKIDSSKLKSLNGKDTAEEMVKISTAMAARTSYTVVGDEKEFGYEKQIELHDRMATQVPFHASPFEHCARAMSNREYGTWTRGKVDNVDFDQEDDGSFVAYNKLFNDDPSAGWCRNFKGFIQYREILENK